LTADSGDDVNVQVYSNSANGSMCWHNGTRCGGVVEVTAGSTTVNRLKGDVAYETLSGDALVVYSTNSDATGDHNLDALMLALVAFTLEKTSFGKPTGAEKINYTAIMTSKTNDGLSDSTERPALRKEIASNQSPNSNRADFTKSTRGTHGHRSRESLPLWTEPSHATKRTPYVPGRDPLRTSSRGSIVGGRGGRRGGPPSRSNI